jgi:hypothetical protein
MSKRKDELMLYMQTGDPKSSKFKEVALEIEDIELQEFN